MFDIITLGRWRLIMNPEELATKLRKIREEQGISQKTAADAIGLPRTAITQIENGNRAISTLELSKFAKLYHRNISDFFEMNSEEPIEIMLYRALGETNKLKQQINRYIDLCKAGFALEKILGYELWVKPPHYNLSLPQNKSEAVMQGENIADQERRRLGLGIEPIPDIANLISNQHIWAVGADLPENISGLFFNNSKTGLVILVNANHAKSRKRFSYAHEFAHVLLDYTDNQPIVSKTENHADFIEIRANAFAAAFLMPIEGVHEFLRNLNKAQPSRQNQVIFDVATEGKINSETRTVPFSQNITYQDVAMMAYHFNVSYQASVYRLRSLNFVSLAESDALLEKYPDGKNFLRTLSMLSDLEGKEEKVTYERELITEIAYFTIEAYRRHEISRGRVFELGEQLGIGGKELFELAVAAVEE
jgi:Zn-dependent peptidase ImmA (M78 family)/DNA-binding XRE family transcriptional regulator